MVSQRIWKSISQFKNATGGKSAVLLLVLLLGVTRQYDCTSADVSPSNIKFRSVKEGVEK